VIESVPGTLGQVGIDLGLRRDPGTLTRVREVAVRIAKNLGDASIAARNLDQDQPASPFAAPCCSSQTTARRRVNRFPRILDSTGG